MASIDWQQKTFKVVTESGSENVAGWVLALAERVVAIWNELITLKVVTTSMMNVPAPAQPHRENRAARRRKRH